MSEPKYDKWLRWPFLWISWAPHHKDPLGQCTNVLKSVCSYEFDDSLKVIVATEFDRLKAENEKLRMALEYYAHPEHYAPRLTMTGERPAGVLSDSGEIARAALKEGEK